MTSIKSLKHMRKGEWSITSWIEGNKEIVKAVRKIQRVPFETYEPEHDKSGYAQELLDQVEVER